MNALEWQSDFPISAKLQYSRNVGETEERVSAVTPHYSAMCNGSHNGQAISSIKAVSVLSGEVARISLILLSYMTRTVRWVVNVDL